MALTINLTLNRPGQMELVWTYDNVRQARFFANLAESRGYHVKWTEFYV